MKAPGYQYYNIFRQHQQHTMHYKPVGIRLIFCRKDPLQLIMQPFLQLYNQKMHQDI
jgi:hypothetical protein